MQISRNLLAGIFQFPVGIVGGLTSIGGFFILLWQIVFYYQHNHWYTAHQMLRAASENNVSCCLYSQYTNDKIVGDYLDISGPLWLHDWEGIQNFIIWFFSFHPIAVSFICALIILLIDAILGSKNYSRIFD